VLWFPTAAAGREQQAGLRQIKSDEQRAASVVIVNLRAQTRSHIGPSSGQVCEEKRCLCMRIVIFTVFVLAF
jgi:hypothetical protein